MLEEKDGKQKEEGMPVKEGNKNKRKRRRK